MRTTIDIDEKLLKEAWAILRPKTKRELIEKSLRELIRHERLKRFSGRLGKIPLDLTLRDLKQMRRRG
ncbi:MAG: type II toxin-antitoxin system VapB family antitoxin [Candidatus Omnitrophica bacterium]|nr:type II toxin-antitoxin system VapB family antitoxin [Candidatus Omnitrophota bacterium]